MRPGSSDMQPPLVFARHGNDVDLDFEPMARLERVMILEASEAYLKEPQAHEGWRLVRDRYDDGGFSGGSMDRPALQKLLVDVQARRIDVIVVYKVDRLT